MEKIFGKLKGLSTTDEGIINTGDVSVGEYLGKIKLLSSLFGSDLSCIFLNENRGVPFEIIQDSKFDFETLLVKVFVLSRIKKGDDPFNLADDVSYYLQIAKKDGYSGEINKEIEKMEKVVKDFLKW